jgi:titin
MWPMFFSLCLALSDLNPRKTRSGRKPAFHRPLQRRRASRRLLVEVLEDRMAPAVLTVNSTADNTTDTSVLTLRDAITLVDHGGDPTSLGQASMPAGWASQVDTTSPFGTNDAIRFNITAASDTGGGFSAASGVATIAPLSALPDIRNAVLIDGYSQAGASPNTHAVTDPDPSDNAVLKIVLDGSGFASHDELSPSNDPILLLGNNVTVRGLVINRGKGPGIYVSGSGDVIQGNFLGTDVSGTQGLGNAGADIWAHGSGTTVGGTDPGARNVISAALGGPGWTLPAGVLDQGAGDIIEGNFIGTDASGAQALGNGWDGIQASGAVNLAVGGNEVGARNVISGNGGRGIDVISGCTRVTIQGNFIGTDVTGMHSVVSTGGGDDDGLYIADQVGTLVGGPDPGDGNVIAGNPGSGIRIDGPNVVVQRNLIGTDATGEEPLGSQLGIDLRGNANTIGGTLGDTGNVISGGIAASGSGNVIAGNFIGTNIDGSKALPNQGTGVGIGGANNTVGGTTSAARNIISGNSGSFGGGAVYLRGGATGNTVEGNYIGTDVTGQVALGDGTGVFVAAASNNTIGGNVISGCGTGVEIDSNGEAPSLTSGNVVQGNLIGTDATGTRILGNASYGVEILSGQGTQVTGNEIAGTAPAGSDYQGSAVVLSGGTSGNTISGNTIASNAGNGVAVISGTDNSILGNSIHDNGGLGISLNGGNDNQAAPVLQSVVSTSAGLTVSGSVPGATGTYLVQFFTNASPDPSGAGEGQTLLGSASTDAAGNFTAMLPPLPAGQAWVSATATVANANGTFGDTSQFAQDVPVPSASAGGPYVISEGNSLTLDGSGSSDPAGGSLTYSWTINGQPNAASGINPTLTWSQLEALGINDGPATLNVQVQVTNARGGSAISSPVTLTVNDVPVSNLSLSLASSSINEGSSASLSGSFTNPSAVDANTLVINWGDGSANTTVTLPAGAITFSGITHQYLEESAGQPNGSFPISVTVSDNEGGQASASSSIQVNDAPLSDTTTATAISATEGASTGDVVVGTFTDADPNAAPGDYTATIFWGDNTSSAASSITESNGTFSVHGSHTYAEEGTYHPYAVVTDNEGNPSLTTGRSSVTTSQTLVAITVADAALSATGTAVTPVTKTAFTGVVASFTDADPNGSAGDYAATITWGDGHTSAGTIAANGSGGFTVTGTNTYAADGIYAITVTIKDAGGSSTTANSTAYVGGLATHFSVTAATTATAGTAFPVTVAALDARGNPAYNYTGTVQFTSNDASAVLPANYTFTAGDLGMHVFNVTLETAGTHNVAATDITTGTPTSGITGKQTGIVVSTGGVSQFQVVPASTTETAFKAFQVTVTAQDAYGNTVTGYRGTVQFSSSDPHATIVDPATGLSVALQGFTYTFTSADAGSHNFSVSLNTQGSQTLTGTDTVSSSVTGTSGAITVQAPAHALTISAVSVSSVTSSSAVITWTTNYPANSQVFYRGASGPWQASPVDPQYVTTHSLQLTGLQRKSLYEIYVQSVDWNGRVADSTTVAFRTTR